MRRRVAIAAVAVPTGLALLLGAEVLFAVNGPELPAGEPLELSGEVGTGSAAESLDVVWIGDSVAAGVGASGPSATLPRLVASALGRPVVLHVFAVSGERVAGAIDEQVPMLEALETAPDVVIVEIGANDVTHLTGKGDFRDDYGRLLDRVTDVGARNVLALGIPAFEVTPRFLQPLRALVGWRGRQFDEVIRGASLDRGVTYVDIAGATGGVFGQDPALYHAADGFHPSDAGYELWAGAVLQALEDISIY